MRFDGGGSVIRSAYRWIFFLLLAVPPLPRVGEIRAGYHEATMSHSVKFDTHYADQILPTVTLPSVGLGRTSVLMLVLVLGL